MLWNDLREYLDELEKDGELKQVHGADWDLEIGVITELLTERGGPGVLFDNIPGYAPGFRVAGNITRTPWHIARSLGLNHDAGIEEIAKEWAQVMETYEPIPPVEVPTGPIFENVANGEEVDLFSVPTPKWHENDGGRYIGTGVCVIQRDPETDYVNSGTYRVSIHEKDLCGILMEPGSHGDLIRRKYWSKGEKCPVVVSVGQEPVLTMFSGAQMVRPPYGASEFDFAGFIHGAPYPVVKGPVTGLPIPSTAEIVFEGFIPPPDQRTHLEGPFGETTGYYGHERSPEAVIEVVAMYHRNNPIIFGNPPVWPVRDYKEIRYYEFSTKEALEKAGIRGITAVYRLMRPAFSAVAIDQQYEGHVEDVIKALEPGGDQFSGNHVWVLVDDDIDVSNTDQVLWAIASRTIADTAITVVPGTAVWQLDPRIPPGGRSDPTVEGRKKYAASNLIISACRPYSWIDKFPMVNRCSPELRAQAEEKWSDLFSPLRKL